MHVSAYTVFMVLCSKNCTLLQKVCKALLPAASAFMKQSMRYAAKILIKHDTKSSALL